MSALIFVALLVVLIAAGYLYVKRAFSYWKRRGVPYIEPTFPFGNLKDIFLQRANVAAGLEKLHHQIDEPVVGIYSLLRPVLLVRDPKIISDIWVKEFQSFTHRGLQLDAKVDPMSDNILIQVGEKWKNARKGFTPAFTSGKLKAMFENIISCTSSLNEYVGQFADKSQSVEIRDVFARYAINVIASVGFGIDIDCIKDRNSDFRKYGTWIFEIKFKQALRSAMIFFSPQFTKLLGVRLADKEVGDFMINTVKQNLEYRERNNVVRKDFFQLLMQLRNTGKIQENDDDWSAKQTSSKKAISLEEMAAQAFLFFSAGYETSSNTMSFLMYELAKNADVQQKAYDEIISIVKKHDGQLTYDAVGEMVYMENCLEETLRIHSPFGLLARECTKNFTLSSGLAIDEGTLIFVSIDGIHYDAQYYEEPYKFKPERFDEEQNGNKSALEMPMLSFGDGPRNCLGIRLGKLQTKLAIITLLQKYHFELDEQHQNKNLELSSQSITKTAMNGINLKVLSR